MDTVYGTCVVLRRCGILFFGSSGSGKSDLALRLIGIGGQLVGDDQVYVWQKNGFLWAKPVTPLQGKLEVRGVGIVHMPYKKRAKLHMVVRLAKHVARLPKPKKQTVCGVAVPCWHLRPFEPSALDKIRLLAQKVLARGIL